MGFFEFLTKNVPPKEKKVKRPAEETRAPERERKREYDSIQEFRPRSFDDVASVIDLLLTKKPAIVYLTEVRDNTSQRVLDILSGAIYALNGSVGEIGDEGYLFTPDGGNNG